MLLHYFSSKEALIAEVMQQIHMELQTMFQSLLTPAQTTHGKNLMLGFWRILASKQNLPYLRSLFEVQVLAIQNPKRYRRYLSESSATWRDLIEDSFPAGKKNKAAATLYTAVIDGLLLELLATGDRPRTSQALGLFTTRFGLRAAEPVPKAARYARRTLK